MLARSGTPRRDGPDSRRKDGGLGKGQIPSPYHGETTPLGASCSLATLVDTPKGQTGRPSKSLTFDQASALLAVTEGTRMHAYIALCLATGIRTEEARGTPVGSRQFRRSHRRAACAGECSGVALDPGPRGHQDREVPPDAGTPPDGSRRTPGAQEAASRGTPRHRSAMQRRRSGLRHSDGRRSGRGQRQAGIQGCLQSSEDRRRLDAQGTAALVSVPHVHFGGTRRGDRAAGWALQHQDHRGGLQARATASSDNRSRGYGQTLPRLIGQDESRSLTLRAFRPWWPCSAARLL
jgi:hypothetical protein